MCALSSDEGVRLSRYFSETHLVGPYFCVHSGKQEGLDWGKSQVLHRNCHLHRLCSIRLHSQNENKMGVEKQLDLGRRLTVPLWSLSLS